VTATLLHISVSPRLDASHSRRAGTMLLTAISGALPALRVIRRDLGTAPVPHPDAGFVRATVMADEQRGPAERTALALSETLIAELEAAELVVIDTPMNNFTVPSALKAWIDLVVRPRRTFAQTPQGKLGMLPDRPVFVLIACGGSFGEAPGLQTDFFLPYLRYTLGCIGISDVRALKLERMTRGETEVANSYAAAESWIAAQVATLKQDRR
jgi:FMN-dependent NADH-azoreductase